MFRFIKLNPSKREDLFSCMHETVPNGKNSSVKLKKLRKTNVFLEFEIFIMLVSKLHYVYRMLFR